MNRKTSVHVSDAQSQRFPPTGDITRTGELLAAIVVFTIPTLQFLQLQVVGTLYASDVAAFVLLPFVLRSRGRRLASAEARTLLTLGLLWLLGQIVTDFVRETAFIDYARGWAKISLFLVSFIVVYLLVADDPFRIRAYAAGVAIGGVLAFYLAPSANALVDSWKFGLGGPVTLLIVLLATQRQLGRNAVSQVPLIACAALLNLLMGFRALAGVCFMAGVLALLQRTGTQARRASKRRAVLLVVVIPVAAFGFFEAYAYAANRGVLGRSAQEKYQAQAAGQLGLLVGGRSEILVSGRAILDSPLLGHGSWARSSEYAWMSLALLQSLGYEAKPGDVQRADLIPTHSHLFGAWVEAGVLGAAFWLWVLWLAGRALLNGRFGSTHLAPLVTFAGLMLLWDVLFSPFGAERRFITPFYIALLMSVLRRPGVDRLGK